MKNFKPSRTARLLISTTVACATTFALSQTVPNAARAPSSSPSGLSDAGSPQTLGQKTADTLITAKVKAALMNDRKIDSSNIHVNTQNGSVTLSGAVARRIQKAEAGKIVAGVDGVTGVRNALNVDEAPQ